MSWKPIALAGAVSFPIWAGADAQAQVGPVTPIETWTPVANRNDVVPGTEQQLRKFSEPSVNRGGAVAFRGTASREDYPVSGVYLRRMGATGQPIEAIFERGADVAWPNNVESPAFSGTFAGYRRFPWFPRIDADAVMVVSRGTSGPVWRFMLPNGEEMFQGTAGVFASSNGDRFTAANMLGDVRDPDTLEPYFPEFAVPGEGDATAFDGFPGVPTIGGSRYVTFKGATRRHGHHDFGKGEGGGNGGGHGGGPRYDHGLYTRDLLTPFSPLLEIVREGDDMPGPLVLRSQPRFEVIGSPSAFENRVVFLGVDDDDHPDNGGIYISRTDEPSDPQPIVRIGDPVPGLVMDGVASDDLTFREFGEAISFNGRWVAFWGAWGHSDMHFELDCPEPWEVDDEELSKYCHDQHHAHDHVEVRRSQGIFVHDLETDTTYLVALNGDMPTGMKDKELPSYVFWKFDGTVPVHGGGHGGGNGGGNGDNLLGSPDGDGVPTDQSERAEWRPYVYLAVESLAGFGGSEDEFRVAFKSTLKDIDTLWIADGPFGGSPQPILSTGNLGSSLDEQCPEGARIVDIGLERDAMRDGWLAISARMWNDKTREGWSGVYAAGSSTASADFNRDGFSDIFWHSEEYDRSSFWAMRGLEWNQGGYTSMEPDASWSGQFTADLNGDRKPDIIWRDANTGAFAAWIMDGGDVLEAGAISEGIEAEWRIVGVGDLDNDGRDDIVLLNDVTGEVRGWLMDGLTKTEGGVIGNASGLRFVGIGDIDADRHHDILWQRADGVVEGWRMFGLTIVEAGPLDNAHAVAPNWQPIAMADLDGDLRDDLVWFDPEMGWVAMWRLDGLRRDSGGYISLDLGPGYTLLTARDLDADGHADLVWREVESGDVSGWLMLGFDIKESAFIRSVETVWRAIP